MLSERLRKWKEDRAWRQAARERVRSGLLTDSKGKVREIEWQGFLRNGRRFRYFAEDGEHNLRKVITSDTVLCYSFGWKLCSSNFTADGEQYTLDEIRPNLSDVERLQLQVHLKPERKDEYLAEYHDRVGTRRSSERLEAMGFRHLGASLKATL